MLVLISPLGGREKKKGNSDPKNRKKSQQLFSIGVISPTTTSPLHSFIITVFKEQSLKEENT